MHNYNVARLLRENARKHPKKVGLIHNSKAISFAELEFHSDRMAQSFLAHGITKGKKVLFFVKPNLDFVPAIYALFKIGAIPVFIDPGMKLQAKLSCIQNIKPDALVSIPAGFIVKSLFKRYFRSISINIVFSKFFDGGRFLKSVRPKKNIALKESVVAIETMAAEETAAIVFTSGSTGTPKGVELTHGNLEFQQQQLKSTYKITPEEKDLVVFPLFALFSAAWGITAVIGKLNVAKPATANGKLLASMIKKYQITHCAGSPAIWKNVFSQGIKSNFSSLKRVLMAGAPVSQSLIAQTKALIPGEVFTPYGATEALPLTNISGTELLQNCAKKTKSGHGTCVGKTVENVKIAIIAISEAKISDISQAKFLAKNSIGEIIVQGAPVTKSYFNNPEANEKAKIKDSSNNSFWHRMGDVGYIDEEDQIWFCGRKDHRIDLKEKSIYPVQMEGIINSIQGVKRSAVVAIQNKQQNIEPAIVVQTEQKLNAQAQQQLKAQIASVSNQADNSHSFKEIFFKDDFPVDTRHNIKINRPLLGQQIQNSMGPQA